MQKTLFDEIKNSSCFDEDTKSVLSEIISMREKKEGPDWFKNHEYKKRNGKRKSRKKRGKR